MGTSFQASQALPGILRAQSYRWERAPPMRPNPEYVLGIGPLQEMRSCEILRHCAEDLSGIETMFADFKYKRPSNPGTTLADNV